MRPTRGTLIGGRYEVVAAAGSGGVGDVWEALDRATGQTVAVKILKSAHRTDPHMAERFEREGQLLARVQSPFVCGFFGAGIDRDTHTPFLVFEHLIGATLQTRLSGNATIALPELCTIVEDVLRGIAAIHQAGMIHRDLKPGNIFIEDLERGPRARLIDFGIAKLLDGGDSGLTSSGAVIGSPRYMAPEQLASAQHAEPRSDVYAAATVAYRALTGILPFDPEPLTSMLALKRSFPAPTLAERTGRPWPEGLERFFAATLAIDPLARPTAEIACAAWVDACDRANSAQRS